MANEDIKKAHAAFPPNVIGENEDTKPYHGMLPPDKPSKTKQFVNDLNDRLLGIGVQLGKGPATVEKAFVNDHSIMDEVEKELSKSLDNDAELVQAKSIQPDSNPKTQFGIAKPDTWAVDPIANYVMGNAMLQGMLKYGLYNYVDDPVSTSTYVNAAQRHLDLYKLGQDLASDTQVEHLGHLMACCGILISAQYHNTLLDDRKKNLKMAEDLEKFFADKQPLVKQIREDWTGFAERNKKPAVEPKPEFSWFQRQMIASPEKAIGRRGYDSKNGRGWGEVVDLIGSDVWMVKFDNSPDKPSDVYLEDFIIDHGN